MLKRRHSSSSSVVLKRHRSSVVVWLPHDVVEVILERVAVKSLLRFKNVSKKWKSTIKSQSFKERQFIRSRGPDVIHVSWDDIEDEHLRKKVVSLGSSRFRMVKFPTRNTMGCHGSCDGLICLFCTKIASIVVNPATGWHQSFPLSNVQQLYVKMCKDRETMDSYERTLYPIPPSCNQLGFGKDKFSGIYKPVVLCNSSEYGLDKATTCEVYDFSTNAWRYVVPASPHRIIFKQQPVYLDGSLYWLTECEETKVISFDLHTETFQVICKAPFRHTPGPVYNLDVLLCMLDNGLCVSQRNWPTQVIWSLDSSGGNKTWKILCSIDLISHFYFPFCSRFPLLVPLAILEKKKLLLGRDAMQPLVIHDLHTKSNKIILRLGPHNGFPLCYNNLIGSIPREFYSLKKLSVLALQSNKLTGAIPASLGDLNALERQTLRLRYLGLTLISRKLKIAEYSPFIEKITARFQLMGCEISVIFW